MMSEAPLYGCRVSPESESGHTSPQSLQGYLAHKKPPNPLGPPYDPMQRPTVGS